MQIRKGATLLTIGALTAAFAAGSFAADRTMDRGDQMLARSDQSPATGTRDVNVNAFGAPAPANAADRRIELIPGSKWVNVTGGETVTFVEGGKAFTWRFDPFLFNTAPFGLAEIAPKDFSAQNVRVYVAPDPKYISG